jgi:hypothetical protein
MALQDEFHAADNTVDNGQEESSQGSSSEQWNTKCVILQWTKKVCPYTGLINKKPFILNLNGSILLQFNTQSYVRIILSTHYGLKKTVVEFDKDPEKERSVSGTAKT